MFTSPSQILFTVLGVNVYYYGVILALAIAAGILVSDFIASKFFEFKKDTFIDLAPYVIIFGIIGARLYYCLMDFDFYLRFPTEIIAIRHGGISIHGAIIGGIIGLLIFAKRHKISFSRLCDIILHENTIVYGVVGSMPVHMRKDCEKKLFIAPQYRQIPYLDVEFYHPTFLYESILDFIIFIFLFCFVKKHPKSKEGNIALIYLILYSFARIIVESCRIDSIRYVLGIPVAIVISVGIIILSAILLYKRNK